MDYYDNWVNCKNALLAAGYKLWKSEEVVRAKYYFDTYLINDGEHLAVYMNYGPNWCDMYCKINYTGKMGPLFWTELAVTTPNSYTSTDSFKFVVDREKFLDIVCRYDYEKIEAAFRNAETESTLEALP